MKMRTALRAGFSALLPRPDCEYWLTLLLGCCAAGRNPPCKFEYSSCHAHWRRSLAAHNSWLPLMMRMRGVCTLVCE